MAYQQLERHRAAWARSPVLVSLLSWVIAMCSHVQDVNNNSVSCKGIVFYLPKALKQEFYTNFLLYGDKFIKDRLHSST